MFDIVYATTFHRRLRHGDAVCHPVSDSLALVSSKHSQKSKTITTLGVVRNHIAAKAVTAVQRHLSGVFCGVRLQTIEARALHVAKLFKLGDDDHPIIWREYIESDIPDHPEFGGNKTVCEVFIPLWARFTDYYTQTRRGVFQSDPILETLLSYYTANGIKEDAPVEDPGPGKRPIGILALITAAVSHYLVYPQAWIFTL
jgi:hypothetical protein